MNKYNYEQRKMIAEFLESNIFYNDIEDNEKRMVEMHEVYSLISKLRVATFGDIKNDVGVKFKMINKLIYQIVKDYGSGHLLILDVKDNVICPIEYINDNDIVEVINE